MKISFISGSDVVEVVPEPPKISKPPKQKSPSPVPAEGAGDSLSIEETNKLRAKLGLKPLEVGPSTSTSSSTPKEDNDEPVSEEVKDLKKVKDDLGEFYHKPAGAFNEKSEIELLREKLQARKDKRKIEEKLKKIKTLGETN
jgi:U4/U6.U5 tri-snRNP-associated protein 1